MSGNYERLKAHILSLSAAKSFEIARTEWRLEAVEISEELDSCPCGQDIKEHCYLHNPTTGHRTYVGNVCVNQFLDISTGTLFDGLKRIKLDLRSNPNAAVIDYAEERGFLYDKEPEFLRRTMRKRLLSPAQAAWKEKINRRIVNSIVVARRTVR